MSAVPCQRWTDRRPRYRPSGERINPALYAVDGIEGDKIASRFVEAQHYSGSYPAARLSIGLFRSAPTGSRLVGVAVFSVPMQRAAIPAWCGVPAARGVELGRFVLLDEVEGDGESWFGARALRLLRAELGVESVLSYSDPLPREAADGRLVMPGHVGVIYQALNARYHGRGRRRTLLLDGEGRTVSGRGLTKIRKQERGCRAREAALVAAGARPRAFGEEPAGWLKEVLARPPFRKVQHPGNHVYTWSLTGAAPAVPALPYPPEGRMIAAPIPEAGVGADPGADDGAVVVVDPQGREVWAWYAWTETPAGSGRVRLRTYLGAEVPGLWTWEALHDIARHVEGVLGFRRVRSRVAVEGLFVPAFIRKDGKTSPGDVSVLIDAGGQAVATLAPLDPDRRAPHRPKAAEWRPRQLGTGAGKLSADDAEALAIKLAGPAFRWPDPSLLPGPRWLTQAERGAVCEAAWIARDALTTRSA